MADLFSDFLEDPTEDTFLRLRDVILADPDYNFNSDEVESLIESFTGGDHAGVLAALPGLMPSWLLSPRAHFLAARSAEQVGDEETARWENYLARACLRGLLRSGDGTTARPFRVTHVADEYDLLNHLGKEASGQRQEFGATGVLDLIRCVDGSEICFDATPGASMQ